MRNQWKGWGVIALLGLSWVQCSADEDEGAGLCPQVDSKLRSCNLLSPGKFPCSEPEDALERCHARCFLEASCAELQARVCEEIEGLPPGLGACVGQCDAEGPLFSCSNGEMISESLSCDGVPECGDGEDELGCPTFQCSDGTTVLESLRCNDNDECVDGSDEVGCGPTFLCGSGESVSGSWKCDGEPDCTDGSDEAGCPQIARITCGGMEL